MAELDAPIVASPSMLSGSRICARNQGAEDGDNASRLERRHGITRQDSSLGTANPL